ncbi:MAG: UDPglucose--hexose-1-phosphate uridylyltransferase, partial [Parcubacteria group bacterium Athens0714_26]
FQNWGPTAGASVYHPHYQSIAIPVVPLHIKISINGSDRFYKEHKKCVYCVMIEHEIKNKRRIIYENEEAVVFTPFFSESPFEVRVLPKKHFSYFEDTPEKALKGTAAALQYALKKVTKNLNDPDYNFFIHTAPIKNKEKHTHYHWYIEIRPKFFNIAGFELGTNLEINEVDPDKAAKILRK